MSAHNCPFCTRVVQDGDPFCAECGGPQTDPSVGVAGIDAVSRKMAPWLVTAPQTRERFQVDDQAVKELLIIGRKIPKHPHRGQSQQAIEAEVGRRFLTRADSCHCCCPRPPIYIVRREATIGGRALRRGKQLTFDSSAEEMRAGGTFKRDLIAGAFRATAKADNDLPNRGGDR